MVLHGRILPTRSSATMSSDEEQGQQLWDVTIKIERTFVVLAAGDKQAKTEAVIAANLVPHDVTPAHITKCTPRQPW